MANYEEIVKLAEENVIALGVKLKEIDELKADIKGILEQPDKLNEIFIKVGKISETYTTTLGAVSKSYLQANAEILSKRLEELTTKTKDLEREITRLKETDFSKLFKNLEKEFISNTNKELQVSFNKLIESVKVLEDDLLVLEALVGRLEKIDLEKPFEALQKSLSDISVAINTINLAFNTVTQSIGQLAQTVVSIQNSLESNHKEMKNWLTNSDESITKLITESKFQLTSESTQNTTQINQVIAGSAEKITGNLNQLSSEIQEQNGRALSRLDSFESSVGSDFKNIARMNRAMNQEITSRFEQLNEDNRQIKKGLKINRIIILTLALIGCVIIAFVLFKYRNR